MNLKPFVNNRDLWEDFLEELEERVQTCYKTMAQLKDPVEIYRVQGELSALYKLQQLRDKVNSK